MVVQMPLSIQMLPSINFICRRQNRKSQSDQIKGVCREINNLKKELREIKNLIKDLVK